MVNTGVAQGSILAAYLFVLYINDLPENISNTKVCLYADDTSLLSFDNNRAQLEERANDAIRQTTEWFSCNGLKLNVSKTQQLLLTTKREANDEHIKFLGVYISPGLKWNCHIAAISAKLAKAIYAIRRIKKISGFHAALTTYHSFFMSRATYAILVWGASTEAETILIQQKKAIRALLGMHNRASCREAFKVPK